MAKDFGPVALKAVRDEMIRTDVCRSEINRRISRILRIFKWGVSEELTPPSVHQALQTVPGLRRGRTGVRESEPVKPVPDAFVDAIQPYVSRQVWAMIELQRLTGMRPGEIVSMQTIDVDQSGIIWTYTPASHKTEHHGRVRPIPLGPKTRAILRPWLRPELTAYLFPPAEATAERQAEKRRNRKPPVQPSQRNRRKPRPKTQPGDSYTVVSYRRAIEYGIRRANKERVEGQAIPHWHPYQLRHSAATLLRKEFGLDTARAVLGQSSPIVTELYAELNWNKAAEAMERVG